MVLTQDDIETEAEDLTKQIIDFLRSEEDNLVFDEKTVSIVNKIILDGLREVTSSLVLDDDS